MNWDAIGAIAELLGAIGVILSLVYLSVQIRQNTRSARASTFQSIASDAAHFNALVVSDAGFTRLFIAAAGGDRVPDDDYFRFHRFVGTFFRFHDNLYFQLLQGMIKEDQWRGYSVGLEQMLHRPGIQAWWRHNRLGHSSRFQAFVDEVLDSIEAPEPSVSEETPGAQGVA